MDDTRYTLIEKVREQGDQDAWELFTQTYQGYISAVLLKVGILAKDVGDIRQDILLKLWQELPKLDFQPNKGKFRTWLYTVVKNKAYTFMSKRGAEKKRVELYFSQNENGVEGREALNHLMDHEWKSYVTNLAFSRIEGAFQEQSIEIFRKSMKGASVHDLSEQYGLKNNTIHRIKSRVKERLILEVNRVRAELE